ncbi:MAG TPA: hypothetical protein VEZ12_21570 [Herpetosiphonaceae bacterium]|nr:hypothetical protein [Herpetosiphonaceae bacterium]
MRDRRLDQPHLAVGKQHEARRRGVRFDLLDGLETKARDGLGLRAQIQPGTA